ncbi:MAG: hypothetical protein RIR97_1834 [Pseudomonadota bacterium]
MALESVLVDEFTDARGFALKFKNLLKKARGFRYGYHVLKK